MPHAALHQGLHETAPQAVVEGGAALEAIEREASRGCSACARALVDARERGVLLAALGEPASASPDLRARVLASARGARGCAGSAAPGDRAPTSPIRDPSAAVAHLHLAGEGEAARADEVDALDALTARPDDALSPMLAQIADLTGFPLLFVSILRGARVGYRAQHGFAAEASGVRDMPREATFCTHCVSVEAPLVISDAAAEPFFRGSKMVRRYGVRAYFGVPLRTSKGVIIGTLCALDFVPRRHEPGVIRVLELFTEPVAAQVERARGAPGREALIERCDSGGAIFAAPWFTRLLDVELERAALGRSAVLLALQGPDEAASVLAARAQTVGRLDPSRAPAGAAGMFGMLLPGADGRAAVTHREASGLAVVACALAEPSASGRASWQWRARLG